MCSDVSMCDCFIMGWLGCSCWCRCSCVVLVMIIVML